MFDFGIYRVGVGKVSQSSLLHEPEAINNRSYHEWPIQIVYFWEGPPAIVVEDVVCLDEARFFLYTT